MEGGKDQEASEILSDRLKGSNTSGAYSNVTGKPWHECIHEKDWGTTQKTLEDHERRISKGEEVQTEFKDELEKRDNKIYDAFEEVKKSINGLRNDLNLTQKQNGYQDEEIKGINDKERDKIRNRWVVIGVVSGILGTLFIEAIKYYTTLL